MYSLLPHACTYVVKYVCMYVLCTQYETFINTEYEVLKDTEDFVDKSLVLGGTVCTYCALHMNWKTSFIVKRNSPNSRLKKTA